MHMRRGFTLVELLVVIIIIAVMMSMIQPMLGGSSAKSRELMCEANLRELGMAAHAYAEDYTQYPGTLSQLDSALQDADLLVCPGTSRAYFYSPPHITPRPSAPIASCVDPTDAHVALPHMRGDSYLQLTAGGAVLRVTPK